MTKNNVSAGEINLPKQTVRVLSPDGKEIGSTYPKRAAGLVKKGRACYMNDFTIRLNMSDTVHKSEVIKMDNMNRNTENKQGESGILKLYFDARRWKFNRDCQNNVGGRSFMEGPDKVLAEAYMIGDWGYNWTEIVSENLLLPKHTDCSFIFWLNGGENDRSDEVCRFEVLFDNDYEQRYIYNLNRSYIRPLKKLNGWELYEIPFRTLDNEYTQLRFAAQRAYMTVIAAKDFTAYEQFADNPDPYEAERPQRHNLIFDGGFPKNSWYSTEALEKKHRRRGQSNSINSSGTHIVVSGSGPVSAEEINVDELMQACESIENFDADGFVEELRSSLEEMIGKFDTEEFGNEFRANLEQALTGREDAEELEEVLERVTDEVKDKLDDHVDEIRDALEEFSDQVEELRDTMEELSDQVEEWKDNLLEE